MDTATANYLQIMKERIGSLRDGGDPNEALHAANALVEKCQQALGMDPESIDAFAESLETRAGLQLELGNSQEAVDDAKDAIDLLTEQPERIGQLGRFYALLGAAYDVMGSPERVTRAWEAALECFERHHPPLRLDMAAILNNLGYTAKAGGNLDAAEDYFLKSLEIMHSEVGQETPEAASVSNNLGAVYLAAGYYDQAREMHMMTLETRRGLFGESHPDTAQSHNNLALALLQTGDRAWARRHFEKALAGFESLGPDYGEDLEAVASNYCDFLREEGEHSLSDVIAGRVRELLAGPLGSGE